MDITHPGNLTFQSLPAGSGDEPTMSSRDIADLTGKRHDHVMRDIRVMLVDLYGDGGLPIGDTLTNEQNGQAYPIFRLPRHETLVLISGYSVQLRSKIIARWDELERQAIQPATPVQLSRLELLQMALAAETDLQLEREQRVQLEAKVEQDAPMVAFAESVATAAGAVSLGEAAKLLGTGRTRLFAFMREKGLLRRNNEPYQHTIEAGLLDVSLGGWWEHPEKGLQRSITPVVTGKGLQRLRAMLDREAMR